jgi:hypothetical protein
MLMSILLVAAGVASMKLSCMFEDSRAWANDSPALSPPHYRNPLHRQCRCCKDKGIDIAAHPPAPCNTNDAIVVVGNMAYDWGEEHMGGLKGRGCQQKHNERTLPHKHLLQVGWRNTESICKCRKIHT